ncbi:GNAT family N-acetyltransferase [Cloacibacterium normanense]|uniref:GNAT family N-acetyltransferase n=1 Tax=Cloacibacterium normanense TaxID=237258 RepID=A0A2S7I7M5_9FLAO|nr:GNAT family N-acetyltransferase [Cloacibacterium normanense]PPZ92578.1 GNAT family N-acetyltransferase [Cloacibacterium normanense]
MKIRKLNINELETLRNLSIQTFKETFEEVNTEEDMQKYLLENLSIEKLKTELENVNSEFYFAENNGEILGYFKLNFKDAQTEKLEENHFEIERIYVLKAFLGQKIGQILFDKAIEIGREKNLEYVWLGVWEENHRAIRFYEKNDFEIFGKHDFVLGKDVQTDLLMKLKLKKNSELNYD